MKIQKYIITSILIISCVFSLQAWSQATQQMTIETMRFNILKLDKAIDTTKGKIKNIRDARFLPDLYLSLAEFYVTKSKYKYALKMAENRGASKDELDFTFEKRLKHQAIETYDLLIDKFPKFLERDKAIFFKAHEQRELGMLPEMVVSYNTLTKEYPKSPYWAESQIVIGDYYFNDKKNNDMALEIYGKILKKPLSAFTPLAHYKMGWSYINKADFLKSMTSFEKVLTQFKKVNLLDLPANLRKTDVRQDALLALVWPYSEVNLNKLKNTKLKRKQPLVYFKALAPNKISFQKVLRKLGRRLTIKNKKILATKVYFELLRNSSEVTDRMDVIERLYVSMKNTLKPWPVKGFVNEIAKTMPLIKYSDKLKKNEKKKAFFDFEIYARDIATRQDKRARQIKTKLEYDAAILDYESYLWAFNKKKYKSKIKLNLADVCFLAGRHVKAAKLFEQMAKRSKNRKTKTSYLQSSLQSYITALKDPDSLNELELTESRYGLRSTGMDFINLNKKHKAVPNILFSIGQSYYDERQFKNTKKFLMLFVNKFPNDKRVPTAANLILDAHHQVEDYKAIVKDGKRILANKKIKFPLLKSQIKQIVQQAEMKMVQKASGDYSSKSYASNLLKMASKYKGSSLGDRALYEAFLAYKAKKDTQAYKVGVELALKHKNSKYALKVITDMGQMALNTADFKRAALFFELYHERYSNKKEAVELLKSASAMREEMGDYKIAADDYAKLKMYTDAAKMDFLGSYWTNLLRSSSKASALWKDYWDGLAMYRLKGLRAAKSSLIKASQYAGNDPNKREAAAHALYLLSMGKLKQYKKIQIKLGNEAKAVNDKAIGLKALENKLNSVIKFGNGRWTIAALYGLGQSYKEFSNFLIKAPVPKGLSSSDRKVYTQAIMQQAKTYNTSANKYFRQCMSEAEKNAVFTSFVKGCLSKGKLKIDEEKETRLFSTTREKAPSGAKSLRTRLLDSPRDLKLLDQLSYLYFKNKDYSMAELIQIRILELAESNATAMANIGVINLQKNDLQKAYMWFNKSLKSNSNEGTALYGLAGMYKKFYFKRKLKSLRSKAKRQSRPRRFVHSYMKSI